MRLLPKLHKTGRKRVKLQLMALAIAFYSVYPLVNAPVARAAGTPGAVVINEFSSFGNADWVELYNTTASSVLLTGWTVKDEAGPGVALSGTVAAHGFFVVELGGALGDTGDTIYLSDETDAVMESASYGDVGGVAAPATGQSTARGSDGGVVWVPGVPTKGQTNAPTDITPPGTPTGGSPNSVWRPDDFNFTWQGVEGANGYELRIAKGAAPSDLSWKSEILAAPEFAFSNVPGHGEGTWYWQVRALDQVKNPSEWSTVWSVNVDETPPSVVVGEPSGVLYGGPNSQQVNITADIQDEHLSSVQVVLDGNTVLQDDTNPVVNIVLETSTLSEGEHSVVVRAVDLAGNMVEVPRVFSIDATGPVLTTSVLQNQIFKGTEEIDLDGADAHPKDYAITILTKSGVVIEPTNSRDGENETTEAAAQEGHTLIYTWDTTAVGDGTYIVRFSGEDEAGNTSVIERSVIVDNVIEPVGAGLGGSETPRSDPLLEQLSAALKQPFVTPQAVSLPLQRSATSVLQDVDEKIVAKSSEEATGPSIEDVAVAATEGGWRVFGILWYWWLLLVVLAGLVIYRTWQVVRSYRVTSEAEAS